MKSTHLSYLYYFLPFFSFLVGYSIFALLIPVKSFEMPLLIGSSIKDAVVQLSEKQLNVRILAQKEDADIAPGTVLSQIPRPGQKIKQHQPVFLVITQEQQKPEAPPLVGASFEHARDILQQESIRIKQFMLPSHEARGTVIGQWPHAGALLDEPVMVLYVSLGQQASFVIFPDFTGEPVPLVQEVLQRHALVSDISYAVSRDHDVPYSECKVKTQKPLAGSLVDVSKQPTVRLSIERL